MDARLLRAMLAVMDVSAPFGARWAAEICMAGDTAHSKGVIEEVRFWLIQEGTELWMNHDLIWA